MKLVHREVAFAASAPSPAPWCPHKLTVKRGRVRELVVPDVTVTLAAQVEHVESLVIERHDHTRAAIDLALRDGLLQALGVPNLERPLALLGEATGQDLALVAEPAIVVAVPRELVVLLR